MRGSFEVLTWSCMQSRLFQSGVLFESDDEEEMTVSAQPPFVPNVQNL